MTRGVNSFVLLVAFLFACALLGGCPAANTPDNTGAIPGVLQVKASTSSLGAAARVSPPALQSAPDDITLALTPSEYTLAFKRIVLKNIDSAENVSNEFEAFSADSVDQALVVNLANATAAGVLNVANLPAGTYNKVDIEVFYIDMTIATIFPGNVSNDIPYRMVFENMGVLQARDLLLWLEPAWTTGLEELSATVTDAGWFWLQREDLDHAVAVSGAQAHPTFNVFDLFSNDVFWGSEHKVLSGGWITPPLTYDPVAGGIVNIDFDVTDSFRTFDYHDDTIAADGLFELRLDGGAHPEPPNFECIPEGGETAGGK